MRNLTARLREIVTREKDLGGLFTENVKRPPRSFSETADALGGAVHQAGDSACVVIDRLWDADHWHGRGRVRAFAPAAQAPIELFDHRLGATPGWARRPVFFDVETTGLSGGAGTLAFLAACGWFEEGGFRVRQFFLAGPAGEPAMLDALTGIFRDASILVTFNGRTFDVPLMETRWAFHRRACPIDDLPHFDMLPPARRLWGHREARAGADAGGCSLSALERSVLRFHRVADVPGLEIPARYFHFLRTGDPAGIADVLEHNGHDLVSLAALLSHALAIASEGPDAARDSAEQVALGRLYERAGDSARAGRAYELAAASAAVPSPYVRAHALSRLAVLRRREARYDEAAVAWQGVIALASAEREAGGLSSFAREATEALAIHHEHRARDLTAARRYAEALRGQATGRAAADLEHRLGRIDRKIQRTDQTRPLGWDGGEGS